MFLFEIIDQKKKLPVFTESFAANRFFRCQIRKNQRKQNDKQVHQTRSIEVWFSLSVHKQPLQTAGQIRNGNQFLHTVLCRKHNVVMCQQRIAQALLTKQHQSVTMQTGYIRPRLKRRPAPSGVSSFWLCKAQLGKIQWKTREQELRGKRKQGEVNPDHMWAEKQLSAVTVCNWSTW